MEQLFRHLITLQAVEAVGDVRYGCIRIHRDVHSFFMEIKWFIQRGKRGYADCDVWGFDTYLAKIISGGCKQLKEIKHSCPTRIANQYPNQSWEKALVQWDGILNKIDRAFTLLNLWEDSGRLPTDEEKREIAKGWFFFKKYFGDLWD